MLRKSDVRTILESHCNGRLDVFVDRMHQFMGLQDQHGNVHVTPGGHRTLRDVVESGTTTPRMRPDEFSLAALGRGLLGDEEFEQYFNPESRRLTRFRPLLESSTAGTVMPSAFANINAFTAVTSGLMEAAILEGWQSPDFIGSQLMPDEPSRQFEGRKSIGVSRIGDQADERQPGMPTKRVKFGERWITQPRTIENSLACEVTQEAVYLDITGQVVEEANGLGEWLGYREELRKIDAFIGVTNTYVYKDNAYNTYQTAGTWDNDFSNELLHYTDIQEAEIKFRDMTDQETGTRVMIRPNTVLVNREKLYVADMLFNPGSRVREGTNVTATFVHRDAPNPIRNQYTVLESPLVYERCVAADGLNLSATNAAKYWWLFERGARTIVSVVNWPMRTQTAVPSDKEMIDRGVVLFVKADVRQVPMWKQPRRVVRNKN